MIRAVVLLLVLMPAVSRADDAGIDATEAVDVHIEKARQLHDKGDYAHARDELLAAYALAPRPELVFALGQVELNLGHYQAAIDYYEQFIATGPAPDQVALAQQAIGAARLELDRPPPPPPPPPAKPAPLPIYTHRWDAIDSALVVVGGVVATVGAALLYDAHALDENHGGTLRAYDDRFARAGTRRLEGIVGASAGAALVAAAFVRWRIHEVEVRVDAHAGGGALTLERAW